MIEAKPDLLPDRFADERELEDFMTTPSRALVDDLSEIDGDVLILGVGGKMGPTLAALAKRAAPDKRIVGAARFTERGLEKKLEDHGVETIKCDLLDRAAVEALPRLPNVIFMAGRKFGTTGDTPLTWAMNVHVPGIVAETFKDSRIIAFSTGNVYPFVDVMQGGATEDTAPAPMGEYAQSCLGRERMFEHFSARLGTPGRLIRLNYAIDTRYGVLHDIARKVLAGEEIDVTTGNVNVIWQGDANSHVLRALGHCTTPSTPLNVSGPEIVSIRALALAFGERLGKEPAIRGTESDKCWLVNSSEASRLFGNPRVPLGRMVDWVADWVAAGGHSLDKSTVYESRDGSF